RHRSANSIGGDAVLTWSDETPFFVPNYRDCDDCGRQTAGGPMLRDEVWATVAKSELFLCLPCTERRLGRPLTPEDTTKSFWNAGWIDAPTNYTNYARPGLSMEAEWAWRACGRRPLPHCCEEEHHMPMIDYWIVRKGEDARKLAPEEVAAAIANHSNAN